MDRVITLPITVVLENDTAAALSAAMSGDVELTRQYVQAAIVHALTHYEESHLCLGLSDQDHESFHYHLERARDESRAAVPSMVLKLQDIRKRPF
jgi:hypothetical protein